MTAACLLSQSSMALRLGLLQRGGQIAPCARTSRLFVLARTLRHPVLSQRWSAFVDKRSSAMLGIRSLHSSYTKLKDTEEGGKDAKDCNSAMSKMSLKEKLKVMTREYGKITIGVYLVYDVISFGCFYAAIKMGVDVNELLHHIGLDLQNSKWMSTDASTVVIAYAAHKVFAPIRILLTLGSTPYLVRQARHWGWMKPETPRSHEVREELSEKKDEYLDLYKERAEEWLESFRRSGDQPEDKKKKQ